VKFFPVVIMAPAQRRVLIVGGSFAGLCAARDLATHFLVTIVDCKEFFEYTPGILRCYVKPKHFDALSFNLHPVIEEKMGCKFIWGEVKALNADKTAEIKPMFQEYTELIDFDYCIIASGCNFNPLQQLGESLWFPTVHECGRASSEWPQFDERFIEGRRRHIFHEYKALQKLESEKAKINIVGAGFIGVEWITELEHFFKGLDLTICDFLPKPLGPLPAVAADYCQAYMEKRKIHQYYQKSYPMPFTNPTKKAYDDFYESIGYGNQARPDKEYVCLGVKASNYFMPSDVKSNGGPGGGGWIMMDMTLAVVDKNTGKKWCTITKGDHEYSAVYAVGDCNYGCVEPPADVKKAWAELPENQGKAKVPPVPFGQWPCPPIPKISYPGEEQSVIALKNVEKTDHMLFHNRNEDCCGGELKIHEMHWPWGAGMFATSLGPNDACFVMGANFEKGSGYTCVYGSMCAVQKEIIEHSKVDECAFGFLGRCIWHFVHHTPVHLWGGGPRWGY